MWMCPFLSLLDGFDVYNIETALPKIDWDAMETHLLAAKDEEKRVRIIMSLTLQSPRRRRQTERRRRRRRRCRAYLKLIEFVTSSVK